MWQVLIPAVGAVIDKIFPDAGAADEAKLKVMQMAQTGELAKLDAETKLALEQIEVNKAEAQSMDNFRAGWRPATGWVCVIGLGYEFLLSPLLPWLFRLAGVDAPDLPGINNEALMVLLTGLLGLGGLRSLEKVKGLK